MQESSIYVYLINRYKTEKVQDEYKKKLKRILVDVVV